MKKPLQVGDRVRLRGYSLGGRQVEGLKGVVDSVHPDGDIKVKLLDNGRGAVVFVYPSQCVRLVKKERREWEIIGVHHKHAIISSQREREIVWHGPELADGERVVVREVRPRATEAKRKSERSEGKERK